MVGACAGMVRCDHSLDGVAGGSGREAMSETVGIWCRECHAIHTAVVDVSHTIDGTHRLRICRNCGARLLTIETFERVTKRRRIRSEIATGCAKRGTGAPSTG